MNGKALAIAGCVVLAACGPSGAPPASVGATPVFRPDTPGLERVMGKDARALLLLFGDPDQDVREIGARKLQFQGPVCVLDAYLYPPAQGREPVVTYLDARLPSGDDVDRGSCIAALTRRREAR
jgi:hypothetical protein